MSTQTAIKYDVSVKEHGRVELEVPFPAGTQLTIFVIESGDLPSDLLQAAESSLEFWNNAYDDQDWNDA
jgi:hypothetical protein